MSHFCSVDIGGTFTDCVAMDESGTLAQAKVPTTPGDLSEGFLAAIDLVSERLGHAGGDFLSEAGLLLHGTTVATNMLVQMNGAKTGLITTRGHGDAILIMRSAGRSKGLPVEELLHLSKYHAKPEPLVPRSLIREVSERVDFQGNVVAPLDEGDVAEAIQSLMAEGVEAIAVCLLWGFVRPEHERRIRDMVTEAAPDVFVTCSHEIAPIPGEYERAAATVINAYLGPRTSSYLSELETAVRARGYQRPLLIMQAAGGVAHAQEMAAGPVFTIGSGPVGGVVGAQFLAQHLDHRDVIATDLGGTSFDVGLVHRGEPVSSFDATINKYTFTMPRLTIESIGAGGGSIIWIDEASSSMRVGPDSAGAKPGPACYGRGGTLPTVTDADVVLGYYGDQAALSGDITLDKAAAERALRIVAEPLAMTITEAAAGARKIVDHHMATLIRQLTVERGLDPRDFVVYAYGGAAGVHAAAYSRELGVRNVVVPLGELASCWSALGILGSDVVHVYERAEHFTTPFAAGDLEALFEGLEGPAREQLRGEGVADEDIRLERFADMKFPLQINHVEVSVPSGKLGEAEMQDQVTRFISEYERRYGKGSAFVDAGVEITLVRVRAYGNTRAPRLGQRSSNGANGNGRAQMRETYWPEADAVVPTRVFQGRGLPVDVDLEGPVLIEFPSTIVAIPPGDVGVIDDFGNVTITLAGTETTG